MKISYEKKFGKVLKEEKTAWDDSIVIFEFMNGMRVVAMGVCAQLIRQEGIMPPALENLETILFGLHKDEPTYIIWPDGDLGFWFVGN